MAITTEIKLNNTWKRRILGWGRDIVLILGMWCIWLTDVYMPDSLQKFIVRGFLITILTITVLTKEYVDFTVASFDAELQRIKKS